MSRLLKLWLGLALALCATLSLGAAPARAKEKVPERAVSSSRITLGEIVTGIPSDLASIDLGPAPALGSSRLIKREELESALPDGTNKGTLKLPKSVRVSRKAKALSVTDIEKLCKEALARGTMPRGATVKAIRPKGATTVPDGFTSVELTLPKPPRREGKHSQAATLFLKQGDETIAALAVTVDLTLDATAAVPDAKKSERGTFVLRRGQIEVRAAVTMNEDADVGDVVHVTVTDSSKIIKGRLVASKPATIVELP